MGKARKRTEPCRQFAQGACRFGAGCRFLHESVAQAGVSDSVDLVYAPTSAAAAYVSERAASTRASDQPSKLRELSCTMSDSVLHAVEEHHRSITAENVQLKNDIAVTRVQCAWFESSTSGLIFENSELWNEVQALREERMASERKVVELRQQVDTLTAELATGYRQSTPRPIWRAVEWQFESGYGEWTGLPAESSADLLKRYEEFSRGGPCEVQMKSGVEVYKFNFASMVQTNTKTGRVRALRCRLGVPQSWTRYVDLERVYGDVPQKCVELQGFLCFLDGEYFESPWLRISGSPVWSRSDGIVFLAVWGGKLHAVVALAKNWDFGNKLTEVYTAGMHGHAFADVTDPCTSGEWHEFLREGVWRTTKVHAKIPAVPASSCLMNIAVEVSDQVVVDRLRKLLLDSCEHPGSSVRQKRCTSFVDSFVMFRVLRIENWDLWTKYCSHKLHLRRDFDKHCIRPDLADVGVADCLRSFSSSYGDFDESLCECFLFHGTSFDTASEIARAGFDLRLSREGDYGRGTYFASQACKSDQHRTLHRSADHTLILSRVALGDFTFASRVDRTCGGPPSRSGTSRCFDTIVARPGPMPGHQHGQQTHTEFVTFDKYQAYPEFLIQYRRGGTNSGLHA